MSNGNEVVTKFLEAVQESGEHIIEVSRKLLPDGKDSFTFAMQKRQLRPVHPERQDSPPRRHEFHDKVGFVDYLKKYGGENTALMACIEDGIVYAVLDEKAKKGYEVVELQMKEHPKFEPWNDLLGMVKVPLIQFAEFVMNHRRAVVDPDGRALALEFSSVQASVETTLHRSRQLKGLNGVTCKVDVAGKKETEQIALPETVTIETPLFIGTSPVRVEIDLLLGVQGNEIFVSMSSADLLERQIEQFEEIVAGLKGDLPGLVVAHGRPEHDEWNYVR